MSVIVSDLIAKALNQLSDFPPDMSSDALAYFQDADNFICENFRLYPEDTSDISLTYGVGTYTLDDDITKIWAATYYFNANSWQPLKPTSYDELDYKQMGWRDVSPSLPSMFYDLGTTVGFFTKPNATTTGGYPIVRLYVSRKRVLDFDTEMPGQVPNYNLWVYFALREFARDRHPDMLEKYEALTTQANNVMLEYNQGRQARNKPKFAYPVPLISNR